MLDSIIQFDTEAFIFINNATTDFLSWLMPIYTAKQIWVPFYLLIFVLLCFKYGLKNAFIIGLGVALLIACSDQISNLFKYGFERLRPSHNDDLKDVINLYPKFNTDSNLYRGGKYGYFSAHASSIMGVAVYLMYFFKNKLAQLGLFFWALIMGYSRIYLGVHYPLDVITGFIIGSLLAVLWAFLVKKYIK